MSFLFEHHNWIWLVGAIVSGAWLAWPRLSGGQRGITTATAVHLINREKAVVIDVCEPAEYAAAHVAGARNVPMSRLGEAKELPSNKALPVILVCASGARASRAASILTKQGHQQVHVLAGGLAAWREASLPVDKA